MTSSLPASARAAPEYFPSLLFCAKMDLVDRFCLDTSRQYIRQSFQNRARIRTPDGVQWLTVPLRGHQFGLDIAEIQIDYSSPWQSKHKKALQFNYGSTAFFEHYRDDIYALLDTTYNSLGDLTVAATRLVHRYLRLTSVLFASNPSFTAEEEGKKFVDDGWSFKSPVYLQNFDGFVDGLSVLDLLFNHGPDSSRIIRSGITHNRKEG